MSASPSGLTDAAGVNMESETMTRKLPGLLGTYARWHARKVKQSGGKPRTHYAYMRAAGVFADWLESQGLAPEDVTLDDAMDAFDPDDGAMKGYAPGTRRLYATQIRAAYSLAHEDGVIARNPFGKRFVLPTPPTKEPRFLTREDLARIKLAAQGDWRRTALAALLMYSGMRKNEIRALAWEDIDVDAQTMTFVGKGGKRRTVPIHPELWKALDACPCVTDRQYGRVEQYRLPSGKAVRNIRPVSRTGSGRGRVRCCSRTAAVRTAQSVMPSRSCSRR